MVTTVTRAKATKIILQNFRDILNDNITKETIWNPSAQKMDDHEITRVYSSYSDDTVSSKSDYPLLIVYPPKLPEDLLTYRDVQVHGTITLEVHTTNSLVSIGFIDQMREAIITNKSDLATAGITEIKFTESDDDTAARNGFKDHWMNFTLSFEYEYTDGY